MVIERALWSFMNIVSLLGVVYRDLDYASETLLKAKHVKVSACAPAASPTDRVVPQVIEIAESAYSLSCLPVHSLRISRQGYP